MLFLKMQLYFHLEDGVVHHLRKISILCDKEHKFYVVAKGSRSTTSHIRFTTRLVVDLAPLLVYLLLAEKNILQRCPQ